MRAGTAELIRPRRSGAAAATAECVAVFLVAAWLVMWIAPDAAHYLGDSDDICQLLLGRLVRLGETAGRDLVAIFGPTSSYVYAAVLRLSDTLLAAALAGAAGFGLCAALLWRIARRGGASLWPATALLLGVALTVPYLRLFRWPQWLFPLLLIALVQAESKCAFRGSRRLPIALAILVAFATLWRVDLGAALFLAALVIVWRGGAERVGAFMLAGAALALAWLAHLWWVGTDVGQYLALTLLGVAGQAAANTWLDTLPYGVAPLAVLAAMILIYAACIVVGRTDPLHAPLLAAGVLGLALTPGAFYAPNINHVLFVISPFLAAVALLLGPALAGDATSERRLLGAGAALWSVTIWLGAPVTVGAGSYAWNPLPRWQRLVAGLDPARDARLVRLVGAIKEAAPPGSAIVLATDGVECAPLFFAERRSATLDYALSPLLQPTEYQRAANWRAAADANAVAVITASRPSRELSRLLSHPVATQYRRVAFDDGRHRVLVRDR